MLLISGLLQPNVLNRHNYQHYISIITVVGELLWLPVGGRLPGVLEGHACIQHPPEPTSLCADRNQVSRAAYHKRSH